VSGKPTERTEDISENVLSIRKHKRQELRNILTEIKHHEKLVAKIKRYIKRIEEQGGLPTLCEMAEKFDVDINALEDIADAEDDLELVVGMRVGGHVYDFKTQGEYQIQTAQM